MFPGSCGVDPQKTPLKERSSALALVHSSVILSVGGPFLAAGAEDPLLTAEPALQYRFLDCARPRGGLRSAQNDKYLKGQFRYCDLGAAGVALLLLEVDPDEPEVELSLGGFAVFFL